MVSAKSVLGALVGGLIGYFGTGIAFFALFDVSGGPEVMIVGFLVAVVLGSLGYVIISSLTESPAGPRRQPDQPTRQPDQDTAPVHNAETGEVAGPQNADADGETTVQQADAPASGVDIPDYKKFELQKVASRSSGSTFLVTLVFPSLGYYLVDRKGLAAVCFFTGHFGFLAHLVGPFHTRKIVKDAQRQLRRAD